MAVDNRGRDILDQFLHALPEGTREAFLEEVFRSLPPQQQKQLLEACRQLADGGDTAPPEDQAVPGPVQTPDTGGSPAAEPEEKAPDPVEQTEPEPDDAVSEALSAAMAVGEPDRRQDKAAMRRQLWGCIGLLALGGAVVLLLTWLLNIAWKRLSGAF